MRRIFSLRTKKQSFYPKKWRSVSLLLDACLPFFCRKASIFKHFFIKHPTIVDFPKLRKARKSKKFMKSNG